MASLMLHRDVLKSFSKLPVKVQKRIAEFVDRFQADPSDPGLHVHALKEAMADPKVRGASLPDGYRAIVIAPDRGDKYLLVHVGKHDDAYAWARNKRFEVHSQTGIFQIFNAVELDEVRGEITTDAIVDYPLARLSDEDLFRAGVPKPLIPAVSAIASDRALESLMDYLPPDCRDVLLGVAAGLSLDEALAEMLGLGDEERKAVDIDGPGDFRRIDTTPNYDLVLVEGEEHLREALEASLEEWRVFLHPYQRKLVHWRTKGPMNITGAAGTGKTVALMHRAIHLAREREQPDDRILVTTFTTNLSITISAQLRKLDPKAAMCIEATNLHSLARTVCSRSGWRGRIASEEDLGQVWSDVGLDATIGELPFDWAFLREEYQDVIDPNGIDTEEAYLTTVRSGRPRISRKQRRACWPVFLAFQRELKRRNLLTFEGAVHQARLAVENGNFPRYAHVLVDEVQDFSLVDLRLISALSPSGDGVRDPLCLAGDAHQRIYRRKFPVSRAGINIRGRSRRLKLNYRTSEQIRSYAQALLDGLEIDDFEGGTVTTIADHSVFKGPVPYIVRCADPAAEAQAIGEWIRSLTSQESGMATHEICVTPMKREVVEELHRAGFSTFELRPREMDPGPDVPGIRLGTMKRIKGLEFRAVALACADATDPLNSLANADQLQRCERYVAVTRARERVLVALAIPPADA